VAKMHVKANIFSVFAYNDMGVKKGDGGGAGI
jgi:hypothetical protein